MVRGCSLPHRLRAASAVAGGWVPVTDDDKDQRIIELTLLVLALAEKLYTASTHLTLVAERRKEENRREA